jgi:uncharacterized radical SAM superfamily Fe-S cluster-containing enzyme
MRTEKSVADLSADFRFLIEKGCHFIQLSGGEPTIRDDLPDIVRAAKEAGATSVQLNSNGLRLGMIRNLQNAWRRPVWILCSCSLTA